MGVDADTKRCGYVASLDIYVEITHFSRWCGCVLKFQFRRVNCADAISKVHIVNAGPFGTLCKPIQTNKIDQSCKMAKFNDQQCIQTGDILYLLL